jgi:putative ABC transport system permease protein
MFKNYLKVALRNIRKQKGYAFLNISGLAIGMAVCLMILLWVRGELSYDTFHLEADNIYRLGIDANLGSPIKAPVSMPAAAPSLIRDLPEVLKAARIIRPRRASVTFEDKEFFEEGVGFADNSFFDIFSFPFLSGDSAGALEAPNTAVITETTARKYFGDEDPIGKTIKIGGDRAYAITGVLKDIPANSHITFNILRSMQTQLVDNPQFESNWFNVSLFTYILLAPNSAATALEQKLVPFSDKYMGPTLKALGGSLAFFLQPLKRIHLHSNFAGDIGAQGDIRYVYIFSGIALFVLLIACINFINLATARSAGRAREVGMRKVLGAVKRSLAVQFLGESVFLSLISLVVAVGLILAAMPWFNSVTGGALNLNVLAVPWLIPAFLGFALLVGIVAGIYPAFFMASFQPVRALKAGAKKAGSNLGLRRVLVIFQFAISVVLIIGTIVIYRQLDYVKNARLGFDKERVVVLPGLQDVLATSYDTLRSELGNVPSVTGVGVSSRVPGRGINKSVFFPEGFSTDQPQTMDLLHVDSGYLEVMKIPIMEGRNFSDDMASDREESVLINRTAVRSFGWDSAVGKRFVFPSIEDDSQDQPPADANEGPDALNIIGVVEDFHVASLREKIEPLIITNNFDNFADISLRIAPGNISATLDKIKGRWKSLVPNQPFNYFFLDESFDSQYRAEERMGNLSLRFSLLAIFVGCLGLFGMASFSAEQRTKEIGIRKVLGASAPSIIQLLAKEYLWLVALSNLIAWPAAYFLMKSWLANFAYRTSLGIWLFAGALGLSLVVALITVSFQSVKAALSDPVRSIRYE